VSLDWQFNPASARDAAAERLADASHHFTAALRDAGASVTRGASVGADYARAATEDVIESGRRLTRSTQGAIQERPLEALLIVGIASFAVGWLLRRMQESRDEESTAPRTTAASRARRRTTR